MADTALKTFNIKRVIATWGNVDFHGFAGDEAITIEYQEDDCTEVIGADGEVTRSINPRENVHITVNLAQSSSVNDQLSAIRTADRLTGAGVFPFTIRDGSGRTLLFAPTAAIMKPPTVGLGKTLKDRTWVFMTGPCTMHIGGN